MRIKQITSRENVIVKQLAALTKSASARRSGGFCLLEGEHLVQSYASACGTLHQLVLRAESPNATEASLIPQHRALANEANETILLSPAIFDSLSSLATPSGVLAIASMPESAMPATQGFILALDCVQDPGNVGALIRTAAAAGVSQVWLSKGSAFAWSVKTLRASQGAHFHVDVIENIDLAATLAAFKGERWATLPRALVGMHESVRVHELSDAKFGRDVALILSNEGAGLSAALFESITHGLSIPMKNGIESLNVATAGAISLYAIQH